jgi:hypothetical protein
MLLALAHPALLWTAAGLVSVPILIHLFFRRRHRVVRWAAMHFLLAALKKQRRRIQVENLLLLILRCAVIALLGLALARPAISSAALNPFGGIARSVVLVVDTSASMGAQHTGRNALDRARERAGKFLGQLPADAQVTLLVTRDDLAGGTPRALIEKAKPGDVRARLSTLSLAYGPNRLDEVFRLTARNLDRMSGRKLVVFVTDLQRRDWIENEVRRDGLYRALAALQGAEEEVERPPVTVLDVGQGDPPNVVVSEFTIRDGREAFAGELVGLGATLINYGPDEVQGTLTLFRASGDAGQWEKKEALDVLVPATRGVGNPQPHETAFHEMLPPKSEGPMRFRVAFQASTGSADRLRSDSDRNLALVVRPPVRFLPVRSVTGALDLLRDLEGLPVIELGEPIYPEALASRELNRVDVVLLADPEMDSFDEQVRDKLEGFVRAGGGLLAYLGENALPDRVNALFYRERGRGLFPMLLQETQMHMDEEHPVTIELSGTGTSKHPLFLEVEPDVFPSPDYFGYRLVAEDTPDAAVVARYSDEAPAVLEHKLGQGRIVIVTTTPDERAFSSNGTLLPATLFFNAAHYLVAQDPGERNVRIGEPLKIPLLGNARHVIVLPPEAAGGRIEEPVQSTDKPFVFTGTSFPGFYRFTVRGIAASGAAALPVEETHVAAANLDAAEGDLRRVRTELLADRKFYGGLGLNFTSDVESVQPSEGGRADGEMSRALLGGVVILLVAELLLAWRFGSRRRVTG